MRLQIFAIVLPWPSPSLRRRGRQRAPHQPRRGSVWKRSRGARRSRSSRRKRSWCIPLGAAQQGARAASEARQRLTLADYLTERVVNAAAVVVAPTLTYHFYPAFLEYPDRRP